MYYIYIYIYTHTHTHTYIYIYDIYIYIYRYIDIYFTLAFFFTCLHITYYLHNFVSLLLNFSNM